MPLTVRLITSELAAAVSGSIISKKGAESLTALVLDVKFGRAALYKDLDSAKELAQSLVSQLNINQDDLIYCKTS